jgi:opacity protein-like surface antigen
MTLLNPYAFSPWFLAAAMMASEPASTAKSPDTTGAKTPDAAAPKEGTAKAPELFEHALPLGETADPANAILLAGVEYPGYSDEYARDEWYWQLGLGLVTTKSSQGPNEDVDFDEGFAANLGFGRRFGVEDGNNIDYTLGLEAYWSDQDADSSRFSSSGRDVTVGSLLLNGGIEYAATEKIKLYGGLGIGPSWISVGNAGDSLGEFDEEDGPFLTWQAKGGVMWQATPSTAWLLGYRFLNADDAQIDDSSVDDLDFELQTQQHVLEVGVQFRL